MAGRQASYVYFIRRADGEGPVKIGCSTRSYLSVKVLEGRGH